MIITVVKLKVVNSMIKKWKVLVIDDTLVTCVGVAAILNQVMSIGEVIVCDNPTQALEEVKKNTINLVMLDLQTNENCGILLGRRLIKLKPDLKVVVYSRVDSIAFAAEIYNKECCETPGWKPGFMLIGTFQNSEGNYTVSLPISVHGYTQIQNITPENLERNFDKLNLQGGFLDSELIQLLFDRLSLAKLTHREQQCAEWISLGKSNQEVADQLGITRQAVENLINNLYHKLSIKGEPKDPSRRVLLTLIVQRWKGLT